MDILKEQGAMEFVKRFQSRLDSKKYLSEPKWPEDPKLNTSKGLSNILSQIEDKQNISSYDTWDFFHKPYPCLYL